MPRGIAWLPEEVKLLEEYYPYKGTDIPPLLSKYSKRAITAKACDLHIPGKFTWTEEEDALLREFAVRPDVDLTAIRKRHDERSIISRLKVLQIYRRPVMRLHSNRDIAGGVSILGDWVFIICKVCSRGHILHFQKAVQFQHELCSSVPEVPAGWRLPEGRATRDLTGHYIIY